MKLPELRRGQLGRFCGRPVEALWKGWKTSKQGESFRCAATLNWDGNGAERMSRSHQHRITMRVSLSGIHGREGSSRSPRNAMNQSLPIKHVRIKHQCERTSVAEPLSC